jgi:type I pantothenate kinase
VGCRAAGGARASPWARAKSRSCCCQRRKPEVAAPVYSHQVYDILPGQTQLVRAPDIVIVEGLNVLQTGDGHKAPPRTFVSDFFDFSIFVDAEEEHVRQWYVDRFHTFRKTVFQDAASYFHRYASLSDEEATSTALRIWQEINGVNLRENILPTRERAHLILEKSRDHTVREQGKPLYGLDGRRSQPWRH